MKDTNAGRRSAAVNGEFPGMRIIIDESWDLEERLFEQMNQAAAITLQSCGIPSLDCEVSLTFADPEEIKALNAQYRGINEATDVLSFPMYEPSASHRKFRTPACGALDLDAAQAEVCLRFAEGIMQTSEEPSASHRKFRTPARGALILGDVVICREIAQRQAEEIGQSLERELLYLFVHSMLHLLGYDHGNDGDKRAMRKLEKEVLKHLETSGV